MPYMTLCQRATLSLGNLQIYFPKRALLLKEIFLNTKPFCTSSYHTMSQLMRLYLLASLTLTIENLLHFLNLCPNDDGILKELFFHLMKKKKFFSNHLIYAKLYQKLDPKRH